MNNAASINAVSIVVTHPEHSESTDNTTLKKQVFKKQSPRIERRDASSYIVSFVFAEEDGTSVVWHQKEFPNTYTIGEIKADEDVVAWLAAGTEDNPLNFPARSTGYWYFTGWSGAFPGSDAATIDRDVEFTAKFTSGIIDIPINWNGASNKSSASDILTCTWGETYTTIETIPTKDNDTCCGAILSNTSVVEKDVVATHKPDTDNDSLVGNITVGGTEDEKKALGSGTKAYVGDTLPDDVEHFPITTCSILIIWENTVISQYRVSFISIEEDGTNTTWHYKTYDDDTTIGEIKADEDVVAWLAAGTEDNPLNFPARSTGYWYFTGWSGEFPEDDEANIESNITFYAIYKEGKINIAVKNEATEIERLNCTWQDIYPRLNLSLVPSSDKPFFGAELVRERDGTASIIKQTHDSEGYGISYVDSNELGAETSSARTGVETTYIISDCYLLLIWDKTRKDGKTLDSLRQEIDKIPCPFADDIVSRTAFAFKGADTGVNEISFENGFPPSYSNPLIDPSTGKVNKNARVISRKDINTLGYIGTQEQFFAQCGGYHTFDEKVCNAIGGYPKTSILRFYQEETKCLRTVYSLVENNKWNFLTQGVDGIHWKYIDDNHVLSVRIEYSDFIDLSNNLFVETGVADWYEVPYNAYIQMFALSCIDMHSLSRNIEEEYWDVSTGIVKDEATQYWIESPKEHLDGNLTSGISGDTFLDIFNYKTNSMKTIGIRPEGSHVRTGSFKEIGYVAEGRSAFYSYKIPRLVIAQGSLFLNKGDNIRVRGMYYDGIREGLGTKPGNVDRIVGRVLTDADVRRIYCTKFANLYRVRWRG